MKITTQHTVTRHAVWAAAMTVICVFGPTLASAQPESATAPVTRSANVSLAGLDLSTPEGMSGARERLRGTAVKLCTQVTDEQDLWHHANFLACVDSAVTSALRQIAGSRTVAATQQPSLPKAVTSTLAPGSRAKKVSLTDLDLSTPDGIRAAHERLHEVARTLCSQVADELDLSRHANYVACVDDAMARALPTVEQLARKNAPARGLANNLDK
jgi:UrcA family protein